MCISATALLTSLGAGVAASKLLKPPKPPAAVDPAAERAAAEARATQATNSKLAERNRARKASSLAAIDTAGSVVPTLGGKTTLGQ